jgi:hypothetical protein
MTMKMVIAPLTFVSLAVLLVYTEPHIPCVVMALGEVRGPCVALIVQMNYCYPKCPVISIDGPQGGMISQEGVS